MNPFNYLHLVNPLYTLANTGEHPKSTPAGLELSSNPKLNLALWNALYVAGTFGPLAFLVNTIANRKNDAEVESKLDKALVSKVEAMRPRLVSDPNLLDTSSFTARPKEELEELEELKSSLSKKSSEKQQDKGLMDWLSEGFSDLVSSGAAAAIPLATLPLAAIGGINLATSMDKDRIKKRLRERRIQLRNIQAYVDHNQLRESGLIKSDSNNKTISELNDHIDKNASVNKIAFGKDQDKPDFDSDVSGPKQVFIDVPMLSLLFGSTLFGGALYNILKSNDENRAIVKYLKDRQLGSNTLQSTPQLNVEDLPVSAQDILATPGDKNEETAYNDPAEIVQEYSPKQRKNDRTSNNKSKNSKKDAIF